MATKTSKRTVETMLDELRDLTPKATEWKVLRDEGNGYGLFIPDGSGNYHFLLDLGESAPEAASVLKGVIFAITTL